MTTKHYDANGMGRVVELAAGFPGYDALIPFEDGFRSEALVESGHIDPDGEARAAIATR